MYWYFLLPCLGLCILWEFLKQEKQPKDNKVGDRNGAETDKNLEDAERILKCMGEDDTIELDWDDEEFDPESML